MAVGIFGIIASRAVKQNPFKLQNRLLLHFRNVPVALTPLAGSFGQRADYPVVIATANRKCPAAGKAWGFVPVYAGSFLSWARTLCPKPGQKIQREGLGLLFTLAPLCDLLAVYCPKSL